MEELDKVIQELTKEANHKLLRMFNMKPEESNGNIERIVDCIIMASALTVAKYQSDTSSKI